MAAAAAEEFSKKLQETQEMRERLRESQSDCKLLEEEKVRLELVVRILEAEVNEVSETEVGKRLFFGLYLNIPKGLRVIILQTLKCKLFEFHNL